MWFEDLVGMKMSSVGNGNWEFKKKHSCRPLLASYLSSEELGYISLQYLYM